MTTPYITVLRRCMLLLIVLALAACVPPPVRRAPDVALLQAQAAREAALAAHPDWSLSGRIAISNSKDGGSGRIDWKQHGSDFDIRLSAPVTRQSWRLVREGTSVRLEGLEGGTLEGTDAQALLYQALGFYQVAWWFELFPGLFLLATTLSFNLLGDSVRDALDPRGERLFRKPKAT